MKKLLSCLYILLCLCACGSEEISTTAFSISKEDTADGKVIAYSSLPYSDDDFENFDLSDPYEVAADVIVCFQIYENDPDLAIELLNYLKGPESASEFEKNFIKEQFKQYPYVARSYNQGSTPDNNYTTDKIKIAVNKHPYSNSDEGYISLALKSSGADTPRNVKLRYKPSDDAWYVFSDSYYGLLAGIRIPTEADPWN